MTPAVTAGALAGPAHPLRLARPARRLAAGGLLVGVLAGWAFDGGPLGAGFTAVTLALAAALLRLGGREALQAARGQRWLLAAAVLLAGLVAWRDNAVLVSFDAVGAAGLLLLAATAWTGERPFADARLGDLVAGPVEAAVKATSLGAVALAEAGCGSSLGQRARALAGPALRLCFIAGPVVLLVTLLLAWGDASFGERLARAVEGLGGVPLGGALRALAVTAFFTPLAAGFVAFALRRREPARPAPAPPRLVLGAAESFGLVGGLAVVSLAFGAVQAECALSPSACVLPEGLTYAQYAHEGFYQLAVAAGVILLVLLAVPPRARLAGPPMERALRLAATVLVVTTLPLLASAFRRMSLYEEAYGLTTQRLWSQACSVLLALWLAWRAVTLWTAPHRFAAGAVAGAVALLAGMNLLDPDALIARGNLERLHTEGRSLDSGYLGELSADATPALVDFALGQGEQSARVELCRALRREPRAASTLSSFNVSRWLERRELPGLRRAPGWTLWHALITPREVRLVGRAPAARPSPPASRGFSGSCA